MSMFKIICVTNRKLCRIDLLSQIERISTIYKPDKLILREKDLEDFQYEALAQDVIKVCENNQIECILHKYIDVAIKLQYKKIHLSVDDAKKNLDKLKYFEEIGMSVHSESQLKEAEALGASYVNAGHIFETDCKKGLKGRGIDFLNDMCEKSKIPVYAIGGINKTNIDIIKDTKASGTCIMSSYMKL